MLYVITARALLLATFAAAAAGKLRGRGALAAFTADVSRLRVLPARLVPAAAAATVTAEGVAVALLPWPVTGRLGALLAAALLAAFTAATAVALRRGTAAGCACFGPSRAPLGPRHLVRNAILLAAAAAALPRPGPLEHGAAGALLAAGAGVAAATLLIRLDDLAALFGDPRQEQKT